MSKKSKTKAGGANLGRALIKDRFGHTYGKRKVDNESMLHTTEIQDGYDWGRLNLASVTEESSFQEFLRTAELAGTEFQAEKLNITFINPKSGVGILTESEQAKISQKHTTNRELLKIPRRPKWTEETTADELQRAEAESFLAWRRDLAELQERDTELLLTPYERNLEFWRQLWRVVERSDVVVQIVDARNPLLFRSIDLERYVKEVNPKKMNLVLINKSDLLTDRQRKFWAKYFEEENMRAVFFSATLADEEQKSSETLSEEMKQQIKAAIDKVKNNVNKLENELESIEAKLGVLQTNETEIQNNAELLTRADLIRLFETIYGNEETYTSGVTTIGLVGYPNVGKSSTINALMQEKKVSVSATPGKTKHFQTLFLTKEVLLCDCPGLVMPSFVLTKADMILNGILPIDQMRDYVPPVNLLCTRIPRHVLEDKYGIVIAAPLEGEDPNRPPHSEELLLAYAYNRGFMTSNGQPDQSRAARLVCKDYVNGKLLYCVAPPNVPQAEFHTFPAKTRKVVSEDSLPAQQQRAMRINTNLTGKSIDAEFFSPSHTTAHIQGKKFIPTIRATAGLVQVTAEGKEKPWRNVKKERREKLRKKFAHLDQH